MKIIIVGATGTMGKYLAGAFEKDHEIIKASSGGSHVRVDIRSPESIENMYRQTGPFDAFASANVSPTKAAMSRSQASTA